MKLLNDSRARAVLAGSGGAFAGWIVSEVLWTIYELQFGDAGSWAPLGVGALVGLGIGSALGAAEGMAIRAWRIAARGLLVGMAVGAIGGMIGAAFAQMGYAAGSGGSGSFVAPDFSLEKRARLQQAGAQEGEIEIALFWHDRNDLDLHVVDPNGEMIFFSNKHATRSKGWLDVDMNVDLADAVDKPVEHTRWPHEPKELQDGDRVPKGEYKVVVHHFKQHSGQPKQSRFEVDIKVGDHVESFKGVVRPTEFSVVNTFRYPYPVKAGHPMLTALVVILGWTLFGALIGCAEGIRRRSAQALRNATLGGTLGGFLGGLVFIAIASGSGAFGRMFGFVILGACIGLFIVLVERALSAVIQVRSGHYEGREIYLDKPEMRIGRNDGLEVFLGGDMEIAKHHATIRREGSGHRIVADAGKVVVNDAPVTNSSLADGDTMLLGKTRLVYRHKAASGDARAPSTMQTRSPKAKAPPPPPPPGNRSPVASSGSTPAPTGAQNSTAGRRTETPAFGKAPPPPPPPRRP